MTLIGILCFGQETESKLVKQSDLDSIFVMALNNRYDLLLTSGWQYIELNEIGSRVSNLNVSDRYKFISDQKLLNSAIKEKRTVQAWRLSYEVIGIDTLDVNFSPVYFNGKRKMAFNKSLKFRSTLDDYVPDMRFVFDRQKDKWTLIEGRYMLKPE